MDFIQAINLILEGPSSVRYSFIQAINLILDGPSSVRYSFSETSLIKLEKLPKPKKCMALSFTHLLNFGVLII